MNELEHAGKVVADEIVALSFGSRKTDTPERQARRLRRFKAALKTMEEAADRLTAMKAAGDGLEDALAELLGATEEVGYVHYAPFRAKARAALKQWKEASDV